MLARTQKSNRDAVSHARACPCYRLPAVPPPNSRLAPQPRRLMEVCVLREANRRAVCSRVCSRRTPIP
eukprot:scaffold6997_cov54-Phaeocystis_antarctica.AAC.5